MDCCDGESIPIGGLLHGAVGLVKAGGHVVGINGVPLEVVDSRAAECLGRGPHRCDAGGKGWFCKECGCIIAAKIRVRSERCPRGYWGPVDEGAS